MDLTFRHNLQTNDFSVYISRVDGTTETVCRNAAAKDAVLGFWHYCNNLSAKTGIAQRVWIVDGLDCVLLSWEFGKGYTFDGKTFLEKPILMDS